MAASFHRRFLLAVAVCALAVSPAVAAVQYIGAALIPGAATDASGLNVILENGLNTNNTLNGFGSAIAYTGHGNRYAVLPDRGPNATAYTGGNAVDNTVSWNNRYQVFDLTFTPTGSGFYNIGHSFVGTTILKNEQGASIIGRSDTLDATNPSDPNNNRRMDPEGIRVSNDGQSIFISDEYGPVVWQFNQAGQRTGVFNVPDYFTIANPNAQAAVENSTTVSFTTDPRRVTNRGMESIAISPDGTKLFGMMQNSLQQEGGAGAAGTQVRLLEWNITNPSGTPKEYVYELDDRSVAANRTVISELAAINDHEFLVLERDQNAGAAAVVKRIYKIDLTGATDVAGTVDLDGGAHTTVTKTLLLDLVTGTGIDTGFNTFKSLLTDTVDFDLFPEKIEGITFGPDLPDGRRLLLINNDNDFLDAPNYIFAFAIDANDTRLTGYQAQQFQPGLVFNPAAVPEPSTAFVSLAALGTLATGSRRQRNRR